jgi:predicted Zn-dependent protease
MPASMAKSGRYRVGVMQTTVGETPSEEFRRTLEAAVAALEEQLVDEIDLSVELFEFAGPRLSPGEGGYSALSFLHLGMAEKIERQVHFLLIVTDVELAAARYSYTVAMPSQLTNIGVVSMRRLPPEFWGNPPAPKVTAHRLTVAMLHTFGHLLNMPHSSDERNIMYDFGAVEQLDRMEHLTTDQKEKMRQILPREAREDVSMGSVWAFALRQVVTDWRSIARAVLVANPLRLVTKLPTAITAGLSVAIVLFFSTEVWDVAGTVELYQLLLFALVSQMVATVMLYRAFAFRAISSRRRTISESAVVTQAATLISVFLTTLVLYVLFFVVWYIGVITVFPRKLMETWPTTDPAVKLLDHIKLSIFVSGMSVLAGSLGGKADSREIVRGVLFLDEET